MPLGAGKYDDLCTEVREKAKARAAIVIIVDGEKGSGFSCQAPLDVTISLPDILKNVIKGMNSGQES